MPYWLAERLPVHEQGHVQRFDPVYWTVDFPRPMMASVVDIAPDALRVDLYFQKKDQLAGLIWESDDKWSHPLLGYEMRRDYSDMTLSFDWRSSGVKPLDAVNGPVLTIEGRDAAGQARAWYVRLWNYANGGPENCRVTLNFSQLSGGFMLPSEADPIYPKDIDRMFISLVPGAFDGSDAALSEPVEGWVELRNIRCDGKAAVIALGDVMPPPNGYSAASAYDDLYNQTPERILRQLRAIGFRGSLVHYCGMSHYYRAAAEGPIDPALSDPLNPPARAWHRAFLSRAVEMGFSPILSLSYELLAEHCPTPWMQRASNGDPALTGWEPPSSLLSPANGAAMDWLRSVARAFAALMIEAGAPVRFQIGEPWWWMDDQRRIYLYDEAAKAHFGGDPSVIDDMSASLDASQRDLLDQAGTLLATSTAQLADAVRAEAGAAGAQILLLAYLPTILDADRPEAKRANLPLGWAAPAFDHIQLEDYDWAQAGALALSEKAIEAVLSRLGYAVEQSDYLAGFVLDAEGRDQWMPITLAAEAAKRRGHSQVIFWAWPQIARDGFFPMATPGA